jgi:hypothetical protein
VKSEDSSADNASGEENLAEAQQAVTFTNLPISTSYTTGHVNAGANAYYSFSMVQYRTYTVTMVPGYTNNDPDLYTSNSSSISTTNWQCRPFLGPGKIETCAFQAPWTGTNYVMVHGANDAYFGIRVTSP